MAAPPPKDMGYVPAPHYPMTHSRQTVFAAELPSQWQGGGATSGPVNTQFRHELQAPQQLHHSQSAYLPPTAWRRFAIATDNDSLTSGFPYQQRLHDVGLTPDQWARFTSEVISAAKLTFSEDAAAWATGVGAGTLSSPFTLFFAPVVGYYSGKSVHKKTVVKKVKEKLAGDTELTLVFRRWNDGLFRDRGIQAWLEPPNESGEIIVEAVPGMKQKDAEKMAKKQAKRFTIVITPFDPRNAPMGQMVSPVSQQSLLNRWSTSQSPISQGHDSSVQHTTPYHSQYQTPETQSQHPTSTGALTSSHGGGPQELPGPHPALNIFELDGGGIAELPQSDKIQ